jgi:hypothetical protein
VLESLAGLQNKMAASIVRESMARRSWTIAEYTYLHSYDGINIVVNIRRKVFLVIYGIYDAI